MEFANVYSKMLYQITMNPI